MQNTKTSNIFLKSVILILWPFGAILFEMYRLKSKDFIYVLSVFGLFVGLNFIQYSSVDFARVVSAAPTYRLYSWYDVFLLKDFFYPIVSKLLSLISTNAYFIASSFTLIYFFFYSKVLKIVLTNYGANNKTRYKFYFLLTILLVLPFTSVNGFRFYTALVIYLWLFLEYYVNRKKHFLKYLLIIPPLIHFAFFVLLLLPLLNILLRKKLLITIIIFGLSILYSGANMAFRLNDWTSLIFRDSVSETVSLYASEQGLEQMNRRYAMIEEISNNNRSIYKFTGDFINVLIMLSFLHISITKFKVIKTERFLNEMFTIILISYSIANLASSVSNGERFYVFANSLSLFYIFYFYLKNSNFFMHFLQKVYLGKVISIMIFISVSSYGLMKIYFSDQVFNLLNIFLGNWFFLS